MTRQTRFVMPIAALVLAFVLGSLSSLADAPPSPGDIEGLEAWYRVEFAESDLSEKGYITTWPDSSGNGHDLTKGGTGRAGQWRADEVNGHPIVKVDMGTLLVTSPFELVDHTIFLVARANYGDKALFRGSDSWGRGIVLFQDGRRHVLRTGGVGTSSPPYSEILGRRPEFSLTVLGRDSKVLRSWVDGADFSSWMRTAEPLEVGALFNLEMSQFVERSGKGLDVAEILFYNRYLDDDERHAVSAYLAAKYDLRLRESVALTLTERMQRLAGDAKTKLAWLLPNDKGNLNESIGHRIVWAGDTKKRAPLKHEAGEKGSRIYCTADGTNLYLYLALPLTPEGSGQRLRALVLLNGEEYLEDDAETAVLGGTGPLEFDMLELETELTLSAGDYFEVIVFQDAGEGTVKIGPEPVGLMLELR